MSQATTAEDRRKIMLDPENPESLYEPNADLLCCYIPDDEQLPPAGASAAEVGRIGCQEMADYELRDLGDPNPYTCTTHACEAHIGFLLGHSEHAPATAEDRWEVYPIVVECKACAADVVNSPLALAAHAEFVHDKASSGSALTCGEFWEKTH